MPESALKEGRAQLVHSTTLMKFWNACTAVFSLCLDKRLQLQARAAPPCVLSGCLKAGETEGPHQKGTTRLLEC